jgi:hypothetical protein
MEIGLLHLVGKASVWFTDGDPLLSRDAIRQKLFTLSRSQRKACGAASNRPMIAASTLRR